MAKESRYTAGISKEDLLTSKDYTPCREWIELQRNNNRPWDYISSKDPDWLTNKVEEDFWPLLDTEQWGIIVKGKKTAEDAALKADPQVYLGPEVESDIEIRNLPGATWTLYRKHLIEQEGWKEEDIISLKNSALATLKRMRRNTATDGTSVRGLVVGHVQSGKTANMAALMAIGADNGYNLFIILSGTIEKLRLQTQSRLLRDLNHPNKGQNIQWKGLYNLKQKSIPKTQYDDFSLSSPSAFLTVSLKNRPRLNGLRKWLEKSNQLDQMKIIIIDDEADQASINTAHPNGKNTISAINEEIVKMTKVKAKAMNYVSYTATPYANFLNEAYPGSLYPEDFIVTLPQSPEHFGPEQIFGIEGKQGSDGLTIIRNIPKPGTNDKEPTQPDDIAKINSIHKGSTEELPKSLCDAVCWFICAAATRNHLGFNKPSSMLIHTSRMVNHHKHIGDEIGKWLDTTPKETLIDYCRTVWERETAGLTPVAFRQQFPAYRLLDCIADYPDFKDIQPEISELLSEKTTNIPLDKEGEPSYTKGIHLCIDNSGQNGITEDNQIKRIIYPETDLEHGTAFIVVGGSTLSRGLTIQGLVSTYFVRDSEQIDTLMQMGRWFGFRRSYELLPRIWMTSECVKKFRYMALVEDVLREDLKGYMHAPNWSPTDFAPKVLNTAKLFGLKLKLTARNRATNQIDVDYDFSGANNQTTIFPADKSILEKNIKATDDFLRKISIKPSKEGTSIVWRGVDFNPIKEYLESFQFHPRNIFYSTIGVFIEWFGKMQEKAGYTEWNVVVGGIDKPKGKNGSWEIGTNIVNKIERSRLVQSSDNEDIAIGVLRNPNDLLADTDAEARRNHPKEPTNNQIQDLRNKAELEKTPQLLIYRISKESKATKESTARKDLEAEADIIGISIWIPGVRDSKGNKNYATKVQVDLRHMNIDNGSDLS